MADERFNDEHDTGEEGEPLDREVSPEAPADRDDKNFETPDGSAQARGEATPDTETAEAEADASAGGGLTDDGGTVAEGFDLDALDFEPEISDPLSEVERERDSYLEALQRLQADFENYKKRVARQQAELGAAGSRSLVTKLLPALDTLTLALAHATSESGSDEIASVLAQISAAFVEVLAKEGLEVIEPLGKRFNPEEAEAVAHDDGDGEATVTEVFRVGYRWHGQTLRPAMVKVTGS
jgi:molecular chaperone GrpE